MAVISGRRYYSPELGRWVSRDPIGERGGFCLYAFSLNIPLNAIDALGKATQLTDCNTEKMHRHVSGGALLHFGLYYAETVKNCKCCNTETGQTGKYYKRTASGKVTASAGAGVSFDFGEYTWKKITINLEFTLELVGPGVSNETSYTYIENECDPVKTEQKHKVCFPVSTNLAIQSLGVGTRYGGLFASLTPAFTGKNCVTFYGGRNPSPKATFSGELTLSGGLQVYGMWMKKKHVLMNAAIPPEEERQLHYSKDIK